MVSIREASAWMLSGSTSVQVGCLMPEVLKMVNGAEEPCSAVAAPMPSAISAVLMRQERMRNSCHPPSVDSSLKRMRYLPGVVMSNSRVCSLADETL